jgi:hypothetical protein
MKKETFFLILILLTGCNLKEEDKDISRTEKEQTIINDSIVHQKEEKDVQMTDEEEVLSVAINYIVDLRKEFVGKIDVLWINNYFWSPGEYEKIQKKYGEIIPEDLLQKSDESNKKYFKEFENKSDRIPEVPIKNLSLNYNYIITNRGVGDCIDKWYRETGIDSSDVGKYEKEKRKLYEKCYFNKPEITVSSRVVI